MASPVVVNKGLVDMYKIHVVNLKTLERKEDWDMQI